MTTSKSWLKVTTVAIFGLVVVLIVAIGYWPAGPQNQGDIEAQSTAQEATIETTTEHPPEAVEHRGATGEVSPQRASTPKVRKSRSLRRRRPRRPEPLRFDESRRESQNSS